MENILNMFVPLIRKIKKKIFQILKDFDGFIPGFSDRLYQSLPLCKNKIFELVTEKIKKS